MALWVLMEELGARWVDWRVRACTGIELSVWGRMRVGAAAGGAHMPCKPRLLRCKPHPQPHAPESICTSSASAYCTVSSFVTLRSADMSAPTYAEPF